MTKDMHKQLSPGPQRARHLLEQQVVVLHVLEHLDADDAVEGLGFELVLCGVARYDGQVGETL